MKEEKVSKKFNNGYLSSADKVRYEIDKTYREKSIKRRGFVMDEWGSKAVAQSTRLKTIKYGAEKKHGVFRVLFNILFSMITCVLALILITVVVLKSTGAGVNIFGYQFYIVRSESMEPTLNVGCLFISRTTTVASLEEGKLVESEYIFDETKVASGQPAPAYIDKKIVPVTNGKIITFSMTYTRNGITATNMITHRIVGLVYDGDSFLGYMTQGDNKETNSSPDEWIVPFVNVTGEYITTVFVLPL